MCETQSIEKICWKWAKENSKVERTPRKEIQIMKDDGVFMQNNEIVSMIQPGFSLKSTKRQDQNNKLFDRGLIIQKSVNPFLSKNDYVEDLEKEEKFLRPSDSNYE